MDCILEEGEMLYIPPKWWHYVRSLTMSFSVSFWWSKETDSSSSSDQQQNEFLISCFQGLSSLSLSSLHKLCQILQKGIKKNASREDNNCSEHEDVCLVCAYVVKDLHRYFFFFCCIVMVYCSINQTTLQLVLFLCQLSYVICTCTNELKLIIPCYLTNALEFVDD